MPSDNPFWLVRRIADEMDRLFEEMAGGIAPPPGSGFGRAKGWAPALETCELGDRVLIRVDLPGVRAQDVHVDVTETDVSITGSRAPKEPAGAQPRRSERPFGEFRRSVALPPGVDPDGTTAAFRDGVLEITVPLSRRERRHGRRVPVESEGATPPAAAAQQAEADAAAERARTVVEDNPERQSSG